MKQIKFSVLYLIASLLWVPLHGMVSVGSGAYQTEYSAGQEGPVGPSGSPAVPKVSANFNQVVTTNDWWSSLIWQRSDTNPWSENLFADPLTLRANAQGLMVGYVPEASVTPDITTGNGYDAKEYHHFASFQLTVGVEGLDAPETAVDSYGDWSVTALWQDDTHSLKATFGHGIPYVFCDKEGGDALITTNAPPTVWSNNNGVLGITVSGRHYGIFGPSGSVWDISGNTLRSSLNGQSYFSVAILPDNSAGALELYRLHGYSFITNTRVSWNYNEDQAEIVTNYDFEVDVREDGVLNHTLWALYRHQWLYVENASFEPYSYNTSRGQMRVTHGGLNFTTRMKFNGIVPELPLVAQDGQDTFSTQELFNLVDSVANESPDSIFGAPDTYFFGKAVGRVSRLAFIADQVGHAQARDFFVEQLKLQLQRWLDGVAPSLFVYDNVWKTLIGFPSSFGSSGELNDHHFHYGYFIMGAATIAHFDPAWAEQSQWGGMVELLIKDVNNWDRSDQRFPFLRHFDAYAGHSWANGPALFAAGNNQESSSEAMNFASGLILWGMATQNQTLRDLGIYLYTTETRAIEQYWFDVDNEVFPAEFDRPMLGILWGDGGAYALFFAAPVEGVHGINFLPINGGSLYLGRNPDYLQANQAYMQTQGGGNDFWRDIHMAVMAFYDPLQAIQIYNNGYAREGGESRAHTYHWIHNMNALGRFDLSVWADSPSAIAFVKNGVRNYVAYNHNDTPLIVTYSDGQTLTVEPRSFGTVNIDLNNDGGNDDGDNDDNGNDNGNNDNDSGAEDLNIIVESFAAPNGIFNFSLLATQTVSNVTLFTRVNGGPEVSTALSSADSQTWNGQLQSLQKDDIVEVYFVYEQDELQFHTTTFRYVYGGSCQECPECPTSTCSSDCTCSQTMTFSCQLNCVCYVNDQGQIVCECVGDCNDQEDSDNGNDNGSNDDNNDDNDDVDNGDDDGGVIVDEGDYIREFIFLSPTTTQVRFEPKSDINWVDIHYIIDGGVQQNVRMGQDANAWVLDVPLASGSQIEVFFTYQEGSAATDTSLITYTRP